MTLDILEAIRASHVPSLAGTRRQQDAYPWLEDSNDEDDLPRPINTTGLRHPPSLNKDKPSSSAAVIDLTNTNGKRAFQDTSASVERDAKRMRAENAQRLGSSASGEKAAAKKPVTIDLSVSPPPMQRTAPQPPQHSNQSSYSNSVPKDPRMKQQNDTTATHPDHDASLITKVFQPTWSFPEAYNSTSLPSETPSSSKTAQRSQAAAAKKNENHSSQTTREPVIPTTSGPFEIDDSSDDEVFPAPPQKSITLEHRVPAARAPRSGPQRPQLSSAQRERQVLESRRRRHEAAEKRRNTPSSVETYEIGEQMPPDRHATVQSHYETAQSSSTRNTLDAPKYSKHDLSPAKDSVIGLTHSNSETADRRHLPDSKSELRMPQQVHPQSVEEMFSRDKERGEAKRNAQLQAHIRMLDEQEKKDEKAKRAAEVKKKAQIEEQERAKAELREENEKQLKAKAEAAQRSARRVALNKLEAEKEAHAKKHEQEKRLREQRDWEERLKVQKAQREALRQRKAHADKEKGHLDDREAALSRLSAIQPPAQPAPKHEPQTNINDVVSKHTTPSGLQFKKEDDSLAAEAARRKVKEIQDRNAQKGLLETKTKPTFEYPSKEQRIREKEQSNQLRREAAQKKQAREDADGELMLEEEGDAKPSLSKLDSTTKTPASSLALPKGPQSLRSAAGQSLLARADSKSTTGALPSSSSLKPRNHGRKLGEILPEDVQLLRWRSTGMLWQDIEPLYAKRFGEPRASSTLSGRFRQVKDALKGASIEENDLDLLLAGSKEAAEKVNRAVHGRWPVEEAVTRRHEKDYAVPTNERKVERQERRQQPTPAPTASFESTTSDDTLADEQGLEARPTTGGKQINTQSLEYWFGEMHDERAESKLHRSAVRQPSPITEDDYVHFGYQVERREISHERLEEGYEIEDEMWEVCDEPMDQLKKANKKAANEAMTVPEKWTKVSNEDPELDLSLRHLSDGRVLYTIDWTGLGKVQTRTVSFIRYHQDGVLPRSKSGWAPKTIYHIWKRAIEKSGDGLLAASKETDRTSIVYNAAFTTLEEANTMAIRHFVALTFTSTSANLTKRSMEAKALEKGLEEDLLGREEESGEEVCFRMEIETEGDGVEGRMEVWVEEGELRGPRN